MLGFTSGQLSELNWLMEGMKNTRTGLRRSGAPCVEGGESRGEKRQEGKREVETRSSWSFTYSKQMDQLCPCHQNTALKTRALGFQSAWLVCCQLISVKFIYLGL